MKMPWKKLGTIGKLALKIGAPFIPGGALISSAVEAIHAVEEQEPDTLGSVKKAYVTELVRQRAAASAAIAIGGIELFKGNIFVDEKVQAALSRFIDAYVALQNARASLSELVEQVSAAKDALADAVHAVKGIRSRSSV